MSNKHNILVVEDELELAKSTLAFLLENGFLFAYEILQKRQNKVPVGNRYNIFIFCLFIDSPILCLYIKVKLF